MRTGPIAPRLGVCALALLVGPLAAGAGPGACALEGQDPPPRAHVLRSILQGAVGSPEIGIGGVRLFRLDVLEAFYGARRYEPAWIGAGAERRLAELVGAIGRATDHGLEPAEYHLGAIAALRAGVGTEGAASEDLVSLDLLASDAFVALGSHLLRGRSDPTALDAEWLALRRTVELDVVLADALARDDVATALYALAPVDARYGALVEAAARLRRIGDLGGWPSVATGPRLEMGSHGARVAALRARLLAGGDPLLGDIRGVADPELFDAPLDEAVRRFQAHHGLEVDGIVGRATLGALNVPAEARLRQVAVNLERWRWLPAELGEPHIDVNVPGFDLRVVEGGRTVLRHRVVVGMEDRQTPMLSGTMTQVVLAPSWNVPSTIAREDLYPIIRRDPRVLAERSMILLERATERVIESDSVDWSLSEAELDTRYRIRQQPGPTNALGTVKFVFSNGHSIFLHDTPSQTFFERTVRDLSSGCVRVQNATDLAEYVLADQPDWPRKRIEDVASQGVERAVRLTRGIPVHLMYWTAWVDEDGALNFRQDLYGRDDIVRRALHAPPTCS
ncbi:MAG: L,D-transpeptidase family protein [Gemmatimonadota bacterium]